MKRYTINQISRYLGISGEMLRHYERKGLISPKRGENGYRTYTALDVSVIMRIQFFQSLGFSLRSCGEMINEKEIVDVAMALEDGIREAHLRAERARLIAQEYERIARNFASASREIGRCFLTNCPAMYFLPYRTGNQLLEFEKMESVLPQWLSAMPCVSAGPCFPLEAVVSGGGDYSFGLVTEERYMKPFGLECPSPVRKAPACRCASMTFCVVGHEAMDASVLRPLLSFIREQGYEPSGDAVGRSLTVTHALDTRERYHQVYLPVRRKG